MATPIRILHIGLSAIPGGMESFVLNYYRHIDRTQFQFDFVDIYSDGLAYQDEIKSLEGQIFTLPNCKKHPLAYTRALYQLLKQNTHPIIHIHMLSAANPIAAIIACLNKRKVIIHSHNADIPKGWLRRLLNTLNIHVLRMLPAQHWACGQKAGEWMFGKTFNSRNIIVNAIDTQRFVPNGQTRQMMRLKCGFTERDKIVGFVGRLCEQKNVLFLADILKALHETSQHYKLLIVGDGPLRDALNKKIEVLGLNNYVYLAGIQQNVADWYQAMDYFALPSLFEGLPIVGVEAQAAGLPCFFSDQISTEVIVTPQACLLPITHANIWAQVINSYIPVVPDLLPDLWNIRQASLRLNSRYGLMIVSRKNKEAVA